MKLAHPDLENVIDFDDGFLHSIVIENPAFFFRFLQDIQWQLEGNEGETVVSEKNVPLSFPKRVELIGRFLSFELNRKPLVTKVISALEQEALAEDHYLRGTELLQELELYVDELSSEFSCDILCGKISFPTVLKALKIEIADDSSTPLERLLNYMELIREFDCEKLFILVNVHSFFPAEELENFVDSAIGHGYQILLVDNREYPHFEIERRLVIDEDLCEI